MTATSGPGLPASSVQALRDLITESKALRKDIDLDRRLWRQRIRLGLVLVAVAVLLLGGLLSLTVRFEQDRKGRSAANIAELREIQAVNERIADCTTAGGACYERGASRTGDAIAQLARLQIAINLCGRESGNDTMAEMERCVAAKSKAAAK
jgi:hypothetical protein